MSTQRRIYKEGRSTAGWRRGQRITALRQLRKGTRIICVSDQFRSENLAVVTNRYPHRPVGITEDQLVYAAWALGRTGKRTGEPEFAIWHHELGLVGDSTGLKLAGRYFLAVKDAT